MARNDFSMDLIEKLFDAKMALLTNEIKTVQTGVDSINKILNDNGKPGLVSRVSRLETRDQVRAGQLAVLASVGSVVLYLADKLASPFYSKFLTVK